MSHEIEVGDLFYYKWGYDQTNIQFFQVVSTTEKTVTVREVEAEAVTPEVNMSDQCVAKPGVFKANAEPVRKLVQPDGTLRFDYGTGRPWDGKPLYRSWCA